MSGAASLSGQSDTPALEVNGVSHRYGSRVALADVSFRVARGSFTVLLGLNGAGKSTLFSLITRLFATEGGAIRLFGYDLDREPGQALRRLGVAFQARTLDLDLSLMQNLLYHAALHGIAPRLARKRGLAALERIGLGDRANDKARNLSGGQMRRVEIVRALLHRPQLLLLDEPSVGLDISARAAILADVRALVVEEKISVLWTTHLTDEVAPSDDLIVLHNGKICAQGRVEALLATTNAAHINDAFLIFTRAKNRAQHQ